MKSIHSHGKAFYILLILICMLIWGTSCIVMKDTLGSIPPGEMIFLRSAITVPLLLWILQKKRPSNWKFLYGDASSVSQPS